MRAILALLLAGCFAHHNPDSSKDAGGGDDDPQPDATCGGVHLDLAYVPPNMGIVLDRSCSMKQKLTGTQTTKWMAAVAAIDHVLQSYGTIVRWGLTLFPDTTGDSCTEDASAYAIGDNQAAGISALLDASLVTTDPNYPSNPCVTNIDTGVENAALDPALNDVGRSSYLMLVTDGAQSSGCDSGGGDAGTEKAIHDLFATRHIPTFVVGFGSEVDAAELTKLANKGGVPAQGQTPYYSADSAADLDAVFQTIANQVVSCTYKVDQTPPDLDQTYVVFGGNMLVPHDPAHGAGWDFDPAAMTITLYGSYCDQLRSHAVTQIDVTFGCPSPPIL
ncbi:MAG: VWA domain-containing protein [Kofleriaceae bacterium]